MIAPHEKNLRSFRCSVQAVVEGATPVSVCVARFAQLRRSDQEEMLGKLHALLTALDTAFTSINGQKTMNASNASELEIGKTYTNGKGAFRRIEKITPDGIEYVSWRRGGETTKHGRCLRVVFNVWVERVVEDAKGPT